MSDITELYTFPFSSDPINFKVVQPHNREVHKRYHEIVDDDDNVKFLVESQYVGKDGTAYHLLAVEVDGPLSDFMNDIRKEAKLWCPIYNRWGQNRPIQPVLDTIAGMVVAVITGHRDGRVHGNLRDMDSYLRKTDYHFVDGSKCDLVVVTLVNEAPHSISVKSETEFQAAIVKDWRDLRALIFQDMLAGKVLPADLKSLDRLMSEINSFETAGTKGCQVATHQSLWPWKARLDYYLKAHRVMSHLTYNRLETVRAELRRLRSFRDWRSKLSSDQPFVEMLHDFTKEAKEAGDSSTVPEELRIGNSFYTEKPDCLIRFVRNVPVHIHKRDKETQRYRYITDAKDADYENMQFVEMRILHLFPDLISDTYHSSTGYFKL